MTVGSNFPKLNLASSKKDRKPPNTSCVVPMGFIEESGSGFWTLLATDLTHHQAMGVLGFSSHLGNDLPLFFVTEDLKS